MITEMQASLVACLSAYSPGSRVWIAYSGGVDSSVLLVLSAQVCTQLSLNLAAVHVHHAVAAQADEWVRHCQRQCQLLNIPLFVQYLEASAKVSEAQLRRCRYQAFAQVVAEDEPLLLAHHQQDQAETLLLRLCRGTGLYGLQGMQMQRRQMQNNPNSLLLLRPWLLFSRTQIVDVAQQLALNWIEDPSNQQLSWRRNFMRHQVLPLLAQQWPVVAQQFAQLALQAQQQDNAQTWLLAPYLQQVLVTPTILSLIELHQFPLDVQRLLLATWLRGLMGELVSQDWINTVLAQQVGQSQHYHLYRFQQCLWFVDTHWFSGAQVHGQLLGNLAGLKVRYRQGGECVPRAANRPHHSLKNLFQDLQVPPWLRAHWPLLYRGNELIAIPHLWVHADHWVDEVAAITWQHPGAAQWLVWRKMQDPYSSQK